MDSGTGRRVSRILTVGTMILSLCLAGGLGLAWNFGAFLDRIAAVETPVSGHAEGAVALTGGADRISDAVDLLAQGHADRLLITGVNPATTPDEIVRRTPAARSLIDCCIALGYEAANTVGNAAETERWVRANHIRSLIVVTSNYHMPRALAEMSSALPGVELKPFPVVSERGRHGPWWTDEATTRLLLWEWIKFNAATLRIGIAAPSSSEPMAQAGAAPGAPG
jgi:uncharacterized SAM-binding protein YcdF (DUF218 family)